LPQLRPSAALLIGATCLGSGIALAAARQALVRLAPPLNPNSSSAALQAARFRSVDPLRRRDAALLLSAKPKRTDAERQQLLQGQGWGSGPLAAVALKRGAQNAEAQGKPQQAQALWESLLRRFPQEPASADALYALGQRTVLLRRFPAHPAALAAALEDGDSLHLARWGARWPGAEELLLRACENPKQGLNTEQSQLLSRGLLQVGQLEAAERCLGQQRPSPELALSLGRSLLRGNGAEQERGQALLLQLAQQQPNSPLAQDAAALLAEEPGAAALARLEQLPSSLRQGPAVQARLALEQRIPWQPVLQRWPEEPTSWELQWQLARKALLQRQWTEATQILEAIPSRQLPAVLAARQLFWQGYLAQRAGQSAQAKQFWQTLLRTQPVGYYSWRARVRLQQPLPAAAPVPPGPSAELSWHPLASGNHRLDELWRTGQALEAWESWRHQQGGRRPQGPTQLLLEGRLRTAIGDDWTGLGQLDFANLRLPQPGCRAQWQRALQQHPRRFQAELGQAAQQEGVDLELLWGVARQESRFSPGVSSPVGAVGLLQLMPETAAELAGRPVSAAELQTPALNAQLGGRYLRRLLEQWEQQPFLAVASYNAGPGAVASWLNPALPDPEQEPELWSEAIPYPETRLYVKKVLGNRWSYQVLQSDPTAICKEP
jgi:soluble lytic murein transglycosylase